MTRTAAAGAGGTRFAYVPALDGLRGLCVVGPVLYHARSQWLPGGFLTIDVFFVLSSFLITSIALAEWDRRGRVDLIAYAGRRARRLLPALLLCVTALAVYLPIAGDSDVVSRWTGSIVATLTYTANWFEIFGGVSYFEQFADPSPLYHTWSLAIEEQFYILVPFIVIGCLSLGARRGLRVLLVFGVVGAVTSAVWMAHLYDGGDPSRVYYGTDTRAQGLLVGIALAALVRMWGPIRSATGRRVAIGAGYAGIVYLAFAVLTLDQRTSWLFDHGGFLLLAVAAAAAVFATMQHSDGPLHRAFSSGPMRYLGRITYGVYLYHWPIFLVVITPERMESSPWWVAAGIGLTLAVATASYELVERPIVERRVPLRGRPLQPLWAVSTAAVLVAVISVGLVVAEPTETAASRSTSLPTVPPTTAAGASPDHSTNTTTAPEPTRVLVVGDSLMTQIGASLEAWAEQNPDRMVVFNHAHIGCPVARWGEARLPDGDIGDVLEPCNKWADPVSSEELVEENVVSWTTAVDAFDPDVVLALVTPWDVADRRIPELGFSDWTHIGEPAYDAYAAAEYRAGTDLLARNGARVLWLLGPHLNRPIKPQNHPDRIDRLNELVTEVVAGRTDARTVDYPAWIGPIDGEADRRRRDDGMHLTPAGLDEIVPWLVHEVLGLN